MYLRILRGVCTHLLVKMDSEPMGKVVICPVLTSKDPFCTDVVREIASLSYPAVLVLEFWSTRNESPVTLP